MKFCMNYSIEGYKSKKYLLWTLYDTDEEEDFEVREFRVCDCFFDWTIYFRHKNIDNLFAKWTMTDFFVEIPTKESITSDIYAYFGNITIVCCQKALYHSQYASDVKEDDFINDCLAYEIECNCMYYLERIMFFQFECSNCQLNFIKSISRRFKIIKND